MGVVAVNLHSVPLAQLAWSPGDRTDLSVIQVYAVLAGASFFIVLCTGLLAFWLHRRARRARRLERTPVPRPRVPVAAPAAAPAEAPAASTAVPFEPVIDLDRPNGNGNGNRSRKIKSGSNGHDASGEYALLRAAAARATTVAAQARHTSAEAANTLDTAERVYEEARRAHAEKQERELATAEIRARHQYHVALGQARAAQQAEFVADTAVRALGAEAAAAAAELAAAHENGNGKARRPRAVKGR
jgi:hypothetical protein